MPKNTGAEHIKWDLSDLYSAPDDAKLHSDMELVLEKSKQFSSEYKGKVASLTADELRKALGDYEEIHDLAQKIGSYAYLNWSTNTEDAVLGKLVQQTNELGSEINQLLVFFDLEWLAMDEESAEKLINAKELAFYYHYLKVSRKYKAYMLSEEQEQLLSAKSVTGSRAWIRFFDETLGAARFKLDKKTYTEQEVLSRLHESNRDVRRKASESLTAGFKEMRRTLTYIFNTLLADKAANDKLRKYPSWITSRNLSNEIQDETVEYLVKAVQSGYPVVQRYYKLKAKLLNIDVLKDYDRYAPIHQNEATISWDEAKGMVIDAYSKFNPEMGSVANKFFTENWIDAAIRSGKRGGAYSASTAVSVHPYVFMNYDGRVRDVQTLAHELGHGVHQYVSRDKGVLQSGTPLTTAETASVFGEMLVFQDLMERLETPEDKLAHLMGKIDDSIATVFRQVSMNRFEDAIHTARRTEGELPAERFDELWMKTQRDLYGDSVDLTDNYAGWWCYIPHFLHTPGYVYAYAFGELLVLALYEKFRSQPDGFAEKYMDVLRAGGSKSPEELTSVMGVDINSQEFWQGGVKLIEKLVDQAAELSEQIVNKGNS